MFDRKSKLQTPSLLDRIVKAGARRVAILGLHPHAGGRTVLQSLVDDVHKKGESLAVTSEQKSNAMSGVSRRKRAASSNCSAVTIAVQSPT